MSSNKEQLENNLSIYRASLSNSYGESFRLPSQEMDENIAMGRFDSSSQEGNRGQPNDDDRINSDRSILPSSSMILPNRHRGCELRMR